MNKFMRRCIMVVCMHMHAMDNQPTAKLPLLATENTKLSDMGVRYPYQLAFTPDDKHLYCTTDMGNDISVFDLESKKERDHFSCQGCEVKIAPSSDGKLLAALDSKGIMYLWDTNTRANLKTIDGFGSDLRSILCSHKSSYILAACGKKLKKFCANEYELLDKYTLNSCVVSMALSNDDNYIAVGTFAGIQVFDERKNKEAFMSVPRPECKAVAFNPDGSELVGSWISELVILNALTGAVKDSLVFDRALAPSTHDFAYTRDGKWLFHAAGKYIQVRSTQSYKPLYRLPQHAPVHGFALSHDETNLASGDFDDEDYMSVMLKSLATCNELRQK